jgi:hypothetical protein
MFNNIYSNAIPLAQQRAGQVSNTHSGEYIVPGPDWLWHDKFRNYGIEIYGIIDAHPRRILSINVGNNNRTQVSVAR